MTHGVLRLSMCCKPLTSSVTRKFSTALANKPRAKQYLMDPYQLRCGSYACQ